MIRIWDKFENLINSNAEVTAHNIAVLPLVKKLLGQESGHISEMQEEGHVKVDEEDVENTTEYLASKYGALMKEKGGRLFRQFIDEAADLRTYIWADGAIDIYIEDNYITVKGVSANERLIRELKDYLKDQWEPPVVDRVGQVYVITRQAFGLALSGLGNASVPLIAENYMDDVMSDYKAAIRDLQAETPAGRLVIMKGAPGTGKTHLIRAMLLEVPDAMFVLVSPDIVTELAGPELLPLLISHHGAAAGPIILILEDADKCLVSRNEESENMNSIQSLLNLGDGILGSMLDLRIVATTNADEFKMDKAITRPGRLSKMINVGPLDQKTALHRFMTLVPDARVLSPLTMLDKKGPIIPDILVRKDNPDDPIRITLAEVYAMARSQGWEPPRRDSQDDDDDDDDDDDIDDIFD